MSREGAIRVRVSKGALAAGRLLPAVLLAGPLACVSAGKYENLEKDRDSIATQNAALQQQVEELRGAKQGLESKLVAQESELSEMRGTYDALVTELEEEVASGKVQVQKLRDGIRVNLAEDILFATGSANLDEKGRDVLLRVSEQLGKGSHRIEVEGHTDNLPIGGSLKQIYPTNWELAGARAARVVRLFEEAGIDQQRLVAVSFGERKPVAPNDDPAGRALNRRIEIRLLPIGTRSTTAGRGEKAGSAS